MKRREFLKYSASTLVAGSFGATAARADDKTNGEVHTAKVKANGITINYEQQGTGRAARAHVPYLAADNACYAFQGRRLRQAVHLHPSRPARGTGETDKPEGTYSMELFADDVAPPSCRRSASSARISAACRSGRRPSLWLGGKYPERVKSLSLHKVAG